MSLINAQLKGILAGYNAAQTDKAKILSLVDMHLLQAGGDLGTIQNVKIFIGFASQLIQFCRN